MSRLETGTLDLPAPVAQRLRRPGWRDPRLLTGLALVAASVALGSWALRAAERTVPVFVVRETTVPGAAIDAAALTVADVRLGGVDLARYVRADAPLPAGAVALRVVEAGELLPASAIGSADALALRPVSVPVAGRLPEAVRSGARVDLWFSPKARAADDAPGAPSQLAAALTVAEVDRPQGAFAAGGATTVHVLVPIEQLPDVLAALAANGRVDVVAVPGS
ncbi:hypothetical protein [Cellulomonas sp. 73-92]|uniref:hypothetical protein n=1 Tax=Cellulomonas sp. 73-92 TaxID=1895740 RepID=UPI000ACD1F1C